MFGLHEKRIARALIIGAGAVASLSGIAVGDDWTPPIWNRFQPFTTFQEWEFDEEIGPNGLEPNGDLNGGKWYNEGKPGDTPRVTSGGGVAWSDTYIYGSGNDNSYIDIFCPNWIDQEPIKFIWIQIHGNWGPSYADGPVDVVSIWGHKASAPPRTGGYPGEEVYLYDNDAVHLTSGWILEPNPDYENIRIFLPEGAQISQLIVDTISVPAPGAIAAFGLAGLAAARRRR